MLRRPPSSPLFPYTTLFRSARPPYAEDARVQIPDAALRELLRAIDLVGVLANAMLDRKSTRLNSSHVEISYAVFCLKKKKQNTSYCLLVATILMMTSSVHVL